MLLPGISTFLHFNAEKVYLVLKPGSSKSTRVKVLLDGKPVDMQTAGSDVQNGVVTVDTDRLYNLINLPEAGDHILRLEFQTPGTQTFAFTFG